MSDVECFFRNKARTVTDKKPGCTSKIKFCVFVNPSVALHVTEIHIFIKYKICE